MTRPRTAKVAALALTMMCSAANYRAGSVRVRPSDAVVRHRRLFAFDREDRGDVHVPTTARLEGGDIDSESSDEYDDDDDSDRSDDGDFDRDADGVDNDDGEEDPPVLLKFV
eukprot:CAMPEP_0183311078 /NCGR_PEP_ID=MMETSP0160_2-20130417/35094_1 /TAXON_ID=2839 ORGANISM="Odontella Sinensis, Strain Grunow 1884" /NCGR_SAMPLE_ID=MMETSP0160_2 /ASSEMBLY_ACC=CAM_ASM_000250 /LENGTH=111 /DNA_ID=CAMNT_0025475555 /DNA_START=104 /DNA_END=435 /DNA_ORIENTATION=-